MKKKPSAESSARSSRASRLARRRPAPLALEQRLVFDGDVAKSGGEATVDAGALLAADATAHAVERFDSNVADAPPPEAAPATAEAKEIAFIDTAVRDWQTLASNLRTGVEVVLLDSSRDGLEQIEAALAGRSGLDAIHILSHGSEGALVLGATSYTVDAIGEASASLAAIGGALGAEGDVLLYGCDIAAGERGVTLLGRLAEATGADVAASTDTTGGAVVGGNWTLERASGEVNVAQLLTDAGIAAYQDRLATLDLAGKDGWTAVMFGTNQDPQGDSQAGAADTDIVGDASHGSLYTAYITNGTSSTADDLVAYRLRIDNPTSTSNFAGVALVGIDANLDGKIDIFISVDGRNNTRAVRILDPGTDANISPSTTSTAPLPTGWLPNNGVYPFAASNYSVVAVSATTDPHWNGNDNLGGAGGTDVFVSWTIPVADLATVLAKPSPVNRSGVYGPRGATGISGFTKDTVVTYVSFTQTQNGPINGDLNGVGSTFDKNATFASLGAFTAQMSSSNPVSAGPRIAITEPIGGSDGIVNDAEDDSVSISGTSSSLANKTLTLTVSDGTTTVTGTTTTAGDGTWTVSGLNLSGLNDGTLTVTASADPDADGGNNNDVVQSTTVLHDKTPPAIAITQLASAVSGTPTISGTSDLPDGSVITITIDADNSTGTANLVYQVIVSGGAWSLNTATVSPVSGTMPAGGLTPNSKITASGSDAAGNSTTATALNRPTVNTLSTNSTAPTITGTWSKVTGDVLTVTVSGATYTLAPSGDTWSLNLASATPTSGSLTALVAGNTYSVTATVTRGGSSVSDTTTSEITITNTPVVTVDITGGATANGIDTTPTITGTAANEGGFVIVRLDPGNDGDLSDAVTYSVVPSGGSWTLDTGSATPISGTVPSGGFIGDVGIVATDSTGAVSDTQVLTITTPSIGIGSITSTASTNGFATVSNSGGGESYLNMTEDDAVTISGTATNGFTVNLVVADANGNSVAVENVAVSGGNWSATGLNLSALDNSTLTITATLTGTNISATNTSVTHDKTAPIIINTTQDPIKKSAAVVTGRTDLPQNTVLTVEIYDGATLKASWNNISVGSGGAFTTSGVSPASGSTNIGNSASYTVKIRPTSTTADTAGNITQENTDTVNSEANSSANSITINTIATDNIITVDEIGSGLTITGSTTLTSSGSVTVTVSDGTTSIPITGSYSGGTWSAALSKAQVQSLKNGPLMVTAAVTDTAPNPDITLNDAAFATLDLDTPTLAITDNVAGTASGDVTFTFTFSEAVTGFTAGDVTVTNGTKGTFSGSGTTYTLVVTPDASSSGTISVSVASSVATGSSTGRGNASASATQAFNTTGAAAAPTVTIDTSALATDSTPSITGTTSLSAGAPIIVTIDTDNDGDTDLTYSATVQSGGSWSLDLGSATPTSGTLPASGLDPSAKITATATNAFGNSTSATGLNKPTVVAQTTNDNTPTLTGTWTQIAGDTLSVVVDGTTYSVANGNLSVTATGWSLTPASSLADGTHSVAATVSRSGDGSAADPTSNELAIDTAAAVTISGGATTDITGDSTPTISGTSSGLPAGTVLTLNLDIDNSGSTDLVYKTIVGSDGSWSVNTGSATPTSGTFPSTGLNGDVLVTATATDPAGNTGTDTQTLTVDVTGPAIAITTAGKTPDTTPVITGTTDLPAGSTITLVIDPDTASGSTTYTYTTTVASNGTWSVNTETATPSGEGGPVTFTNGNTLGLSASGEDSVGNSTSTTKNLQITTAPTIAITSPLPTVGADNIADATEDDAIVIVGTTTNVADGSTITVNISDGTTTITDTATVTGNAWSLAAINLSNLASGTISLTAVVVDTDGSAYTATGSFTHDKTTTVAIDSISEDTGVLADFVTKDSTVAITGSATANSAVTVVVKDSGNATVATFNVTSNGSGVWSTAATSSLTAGDYTIEATVGGTTATKALTIVDSTAPTLTASTPADGATNVAVGNDLTLTFSKNIQAGTGFISLYKSDGTLIENFNVATGTGDAGGTIAFNGTTGITLNPVANLDASTTYYLNIASGAVIDSVANAYAGISDSTTLNFTTAAAADTTATAAPSVDLVAASDSGTSDSDDKTNDTTPTIRVALNGAGATAPVAGDVVKLYEGATEIGSATLTAQNISDDYVEITPSSALAAGAKSFTATVTDQASTPNVSSASNALAVTIDTTAPTLATASVSGTTLVLTYTEAGVGLSSTTPATGDFTVTKNGSTGVTVNNVSIDTSAKTVTLTLASTITNADTVTVSYTAGTNKTQDIAGNVSADLTNQAVTNNSDDTTAPAAPSLDLNPGSDSGTSTSDDKTNDTTPTIRVSLNGINATAPLAGDVVKLYEGATQVGSATLTATDITRDYVDITTSTLTEGVKSFTATVTDQAATPNVSSASTALAVTIDTTAPAIASAAVNGTSLVLTYTENGAGLASTTPDADDYAVTKNGSAVAVTNVAVDTTNKTVTLTLASAVTNADTVLVSYTSDTNKLRDVAGNVAADLSDQAVTNNSGDTTAPAAPSLDLVAASDSGTSDSDEKTNDTTPTIRVSLNGTGVTAPVAGDIVKLYEGATEIGSATLSAQNITDDYIDITPGSSVGTGAKSFTATVTDQAGTPNVSSASSALAVTVDTTAPAISSAAVSGTTLVLTYTEAGAGLAGTTPAASDFTVRKNGPTTIAVSNVAVDTSAKTVTLTLASAIVVGDTVTVSYSAGTDNLQDVAGNVAANYADQAVTNNGTDTTPPTATITVTDTALKIGETSGVTIEFSEAVSGFTNADLTVANGTLSNVSSSDGGVTWTATLTPTAGTEDATNIITLDNTGVIDAANNTGTGTTNSNNYAVDTKVYEPSITSDDVSGIIVAGETPTLYLTFDEAPVGFTIADVSVESGSLSDFAQVDSKTYTVKYTPAANTLDTTMLVEIGTGYTDAAGNTGQGTGVYLNVNTSVPTVAITSDKAAVNVGEAATLTFTFSVAPTGFADTDITVESGSISNFTITADPKVYTATYTPAANTEDAAMQVSIANGAFTDSNSVAGTGDTENLAVDTKRPTATITLSDSALRVGETSTVTITFTEAVTGFTTADLTVANGALSSLSSADGGTTWTATFTPDSDIEDTTNAVTLDKTGVADAAGNTGTGSSTSDNYTIDTKRPTATIAVADAALKAGETSAVTITFSEAVTSFANADLTIANGTLSAVSSSDGGTTWTATFTPTADVEDTTNVITLANTGVSDVAGNAGSGTTDSNNYAIDTKAPTVTITSSDATVTAGETATLTFTFSEAPTGFTAADVSVESGAISDLAVTADPKIYTATYTPAANTVDAAMAVEVGAGYTDAAGNTGAGDSLELAINTVAPSVAVTSDKATLKIGETATLTFTFSAVPTGFTDADITVESGAISNLTVTADPKVYTATYTPSVSTEDTVMAVSVGTGYTDANGNQGTGDTESIAVDTKRPTATLTLSDTALRVGETSTVTITFTEAVTGFTTADLTVANGALSSLSSADGGTTWTATFTPDSDIEDTTNAVTLDKTGVADAAGNAGTGSSTSDNYAVDTKRPTATIAVADAALKAGETSAVTITFSEAVTGFANADLTIANGTLSAVSSSDGGVTWTATFTPTADVEDTTNVITLANTGVSDVAGNAGSGTTDSNNYAIDTKAPTVTITSSDATVTAGETATLTFTFSEAPTGFTAADVSVESGAISDLAVTADPKVYTATYTPAASTSDATMAVSVGTGYTDAAGNTGSGHSLDLAVNTVVPSVAITSDKAAVKAGETATLTFTFSAVPTGFTDADITVESGSISNLAVTADPKVYTATYTPATNTEDAAMAVSVGTGYTDSNGNTGTGDSENVAVDTKRPTATIAVADTALKAGETSGVTITFSEAVTGFTNADLTIANGTLSAVSSSDGGTTWTATFAPTADIEDTTNVITLDNTGVADAAGNAGTGTTDSNSYAIDTKRPTATIAMADTALKAGETSAVTITFSEAVTGLTNADLTIVNGTLSAVSSSDGGVTWTATFTPTASIEDATNVVTLANGGVADAASNTGSGTTDSSNYAIDTLAPTVAITSSVGALKAGETATLTFTFSEAPTGFAIGDISVESGSLSDFATTADPKVFTAKYTPSANTADATMSVSVGTGYTDAAGNTGSGASENLAIDTQAPTVAITSSTGALKAGETATLTFTFSETPTGFAADDISVESGSISDFAATAEPKVFTAKYTPAANTEDATTSVSVGTGYTDAIGNTGSGDSENLAVDTKAPTVAITSDVSSVNSTGTATLTFTFSEAPTGFTDADISVESGSVSDFTVTADPKVYTAKYTPAANTSDSSMVVSVGTTYTDAAGNTGAGDTESLAVNSVSPSVAITSSAAALKAGETATLTFTFSAAPVGFTIADVAVESGSLSNFTVTADPKVYTATYTPATDTEDAAMNVSVGTGYTDADGNTGIGDSENLAVDTKVPIVAITSSASALKAGETATLTFTFSEAPTGFTAVDVTVESGALSDFTATADPKVFTAKYTPAANTEDAAMNVAVGTGYADVAGNSGSGDADDLAVDTKAPTLAITSGAAALKAGETATLTFTFSEAPSGFTLADVTLESGTLSNLTATADPKIYTATYTPAGNTEDAAMNVSVATGYTDAAGNTGAGDAESLAIDTKAPVITGPSGGAGSATATATIPENTTGVTTFTASEAVTWSVAGGEDATKFTIDAATGALAFIAAPDFEAPTDGATSGGNTYLVVVRATDAVGQSSTQTVTVTVTNVNEAPVASTVPDAATVVGAAMTPITVPAFSDVDSPTLTYVATLGDGSALPNWLSFDAASRTFSGTPPAGTTVETLNVRVTGSDGSLSASTTFGLTVANPGAPIALGDSAIATEAGGTNNGTGGANATGNVLANDTGATIRVTSANGAAIAGAFGTLSIGVDGVYAYTLDNTNRAVEALNVGGTLTDTFSYTITDQAGQTATATLRVTIHGANDAAVPSSVEGGSVVVGSPLEPITVPAFTDVDNATLTYSARLDDGSPLPGWLSFDPATRTFTGTPPAGTESGTLGITVTANDGTVTSSTSFDLIVGKPLAPVATPDVATANEAGGANNATAGSSASGNVLDNDRGTQLAVTSGTSFTGAFGSLTIGRDGAFTYVVDDANATVQALNVGGTLADTFNYTITDQAGQTASASVTITINGANDAAVPSTVSGGPAVIGSPLTPITVPAFADVDNATLTYAATLADGGPLPAWLSFDPATRTFTGTPPAGTNPGALDIKVTATGPGETASTNFTLTIDRPAAPTVTGDEATAVEASGVDNTIAGINPTGNVLANDAGAKLSVTGAQAGTSFTSGGVGTVTGVFGTLEIAADGTFAYRVDNAHPSVEALNPGEALVDSFTYQTTDQAGQRATATLRVTINGATDVPPPAPPVEIPPIVVIDPTTPTTPTTPITTPVNDGGTSTTPTIVSVGETTTSLTTPTTTSTGESGAGLSLGFGFSEGAFTAADNSFRIVVIPSEVPSLMIYRGVPDQFAEANMPISFTIPSDAFAHTRAGAQVTLTATLTDGAPLPDWLTFNKSSGTFQGMPPRDFEGEIKIKVIAIDAQGMQAEAVFRFNVGKVDGVARPGLSEQLRKVSYLNARSRGLAPAAR